MNEITAIAEEGISTKPVPALELSVEDLMTESAMNSLGVSEQKSEEAKRELDEYIAVMLEKEQEDAFEAVRYAIYKVVPQVMTYREAVLEETADQFKVVNDLNSDMLDMQGKYAASGDTTMINDIQAIGVENAYEYFQKANMNAEKVKQMMDEGLLPKGIGQTMLSNLNEITNSTYTYFEFSDFEPRNYKYGQAVGLFNGLVGNEMYATVTSDSSGGNQSYFTRPLPTAEQDIWDDDRTWALKQEMDHGPYASGLNDNNSVIQMSLNGYSKEVEADFKFKIEEYGQYLSLSSQMYDSGNKGVKVHVSGQRG